MQDVINYIKNQSIMVIVIVILVLFVIHSIFAVFLNKLNNAKYGKTTPIAWLPGFNIYLLGKLAIHWLIGLLLLGGFFLGICTEYTIPKLESIHNLLPNEYILPYQIAYVVIIVILFIMAKIKLNRIIKLGTGKDSMSSYINKDYDKKEPEIVTNTNQVNEVSETIKDNFKYNNTSLSSLSNHDINNVNSNNNQNP